MNLVFIDTETTGLEPMRSQVIELAAVFTDAQGNILKEYETLVRRDQEFSWGGEHIHGIREEYLISAPSIAEVCEEFAGLLDKYGAPGIQWCEHSSRGKEQFSFDYAMVQAMFLHNGNHFEFTKRIRGENVLSTHRMSQKVKLKKIYGAESYKLGDCCQIFGIEMPIKHRALHDAKATKELYFKLKELTHEVGDYAPRAGADKRERCEIQERKEKKANKRLGGAVSEIAGPLFKTA